MQVKAHSESSAVAPLCPASLAPLCTSSDRLRLQQPRSSASRSPDGEINLSIIPHRSCPTILRAGVGHLTHLTQPAHTNTRAHQSARWHSHCLTPSLLHQRSAPWRALDFSIGLTRTRPNRAVTPVVVWPRVLVVWLLLVRILPAPDQQTNHSERQYERA